MRTFAAILTGTRRDHVKLIAANEDGQLADPETGQVYKHGNAFLGRQLAKQVQDFEKVFYKTASPGGLLTYWGVSPQVEGGQITGLVTEKEINGVWHENQLEDWQFEMLGVDHTDLGCVEAHPEGSDRGGYVPTLTNGCHFDENANEWRG